MSCRHVRTQTSDRKRNDQLSGTSRIKGVELVRVCRCRGVGHREGGQGAREDDGPEHRQVKVHRLPAGQHRRLHPSAEARRLQPHLRQQ